MDNNKRKLIYSAIKKKKELQGLKENLIEKELNKLLLRNPKLLKISKEKDLKKFDRSAVFKRIVKDIRRVLHRSHGVFQKDKSKRAAILEELKMSKNKVSLVPPKKLLSTNISTKERIDSYKRLYSQIFDITSKPKSILDLGSGLNPLSFPYMGLKEVKYLATEINQSDVKFLNDYFTIMKNQGLNGKAELLDLTEPSSLETLQNLSQVDVCFMFKLLESLEETKKRKFKLIERILLSLKSEWIIVSFATKTVAQKNIKFKQTKWFDSMLQRLNKEFIKIEFSNEIFYVIKN